MTRRLFCLLAMIMGTISALLAQNPHVGDIYYLFNTDGTAVVTSRFDHDTYYNYGRKITKADIPDTVVYKDQPYVVVAIDYNAFRGCSDLDFLSIPCTVTEIGEKAFEGCTRLSTVAINSPSLVGKNHTPTSNFTRLFGAQVKHYHLGDSITAIGEYAFYGNDSLPVIDGLRYVDSVYVVEAADKQRTTYSFLPTTRFIGSAAFDGCDRLTAIDLPEGITRIGSRAFRDCANLQSLSLPASLTAVGDLAFDGCTALQAVHTPGIDAWCRISFSSFSANPLYHAHTLYIDKVPVTDLALPDTLRVIPDYAFIGCDMSSIVFPDSLRTIGENAFAGCNRLTTLALPDSLHTIRQGAFRQCDALADIVFPARLTTIGERAFRQCTSLTSLTLPAGLRTVERFLCDSCIALETLIVPEPVSRIRDGAFRDCAALRTLILPSSLDSIDASVFQRCINLTEPVIPGNTTLVGDYAFNGCTGFTAVTVPAQVQTIGDNAFSDCANMHTLFIPNSVRLIGNDAFARCPQLDTVILDSHAIVARDYNATRHVSSLFGQQVKHYRLGESVIAIGNCAFEDCRTLLSVHIPHTVTSIGKNAFHNCVSLLALTVPESVTDIRQNAFGKVPNIIRSGDATTPVAGARALNGFVDGMLVYNDSSRSALLACSALRQGDITLPETVTSVGNSAFYLCDRLSSIALPSTLTSIADSAFWNCIRLTTLSVPDAVASIGTAAFHQLPNVAYSGTATGTPWEARSVNGFVDNWLVYQNNSKKTLKACSAAATGHIDLPASLIYINQQAFSGCSAIESLSWSSAITSVKKDAFEGCTGLQALYISDLSAWCKIAFSSIAANPLTYAHNLYLDSTLIQSLVIPSDISALKAYAFYGAACFNEIKIHNTVTSIAKNAFAYCSQLDKLTLGTGIKTYGDGAFAGCTALREVTNPQSVPLELKNVFIFPTTIYTNCQLFVPKGCVNAYKESPTWRFFYSIQTISNTSQMPVFHVMARNAEEGSVNDSINGAYDYYTELQAVAVPHDGYSFDRWDDGVTDNPRTITLLQDTTIVAIFSKSNDVATDLDPVTHNPSPVTHKVLVNERLLILRGTETYTITGQKVR